MLRKKSYRKNSKSKEDKWDVVIGPKINFVFVPLKELLRCYELILLFVRRDLVTNYVQTILGPLWLIFQPLGTALVYTVVFSVILRVPTDEIPHFLFFMSGSVLWIYFSTCFMNISRVMIANSHIFQKIYFPRLVIPVSIVISSLVMLLVNIMIIFGAIWIYSLNGYSIVLNWKLILLPLVIAQVILLGLGCGLIVASFIIKYRDLNHLMTFIIQLWMFASPVFYPISIIPEKFRFFFSINPMISIIELFRLGIFNKSSITLLEIFLSWGITLFFLVSGLFLFSRAEHSFVDVA